MRIKVYRAASMAAAMDRVRGELGADALIVGSRRVAGGMEVTAAVEASDAAVAAPAAVAAAAPRPAAAARDDLLAWHGVPPGVARKLAGGPLAFALAAALRFRPLALGTEARVLLCGPPGAGKTLTAARLATRLVLGGTAPVVVTTDTRRAGAAEQLAAFTRVLGLELLEADDVASLAGMLRDRAGPVLIDTAGCNGFDAGDLAELCGWAGAARAEPVLVLPAALDAMEAAEMAAALDAMEAAEMAAAFGTAGVTALVATRLDLARRLGGVLAAAAAGLALAEGGIGPGAADGLIALTPGWLARRLEQGPAAGRLGDARCSG